MKKHTLIIAMLFLIALQNANAADGDKRWRCTV